MNTKQGRKTTQDKRDVHAVLRGQDHGDVPDPFLHHRPTASADDDDGVERVVRQNFQIASHLIMRQVGERDMSQE